MGRQPIVAATKAQRAVILREYRDSDGYWIDLVPGFRVLGDAHGIVEDTKRAAYDKLSSVVPCACPDCKAQPGYKEPKP
jgi:hypothetical protein